MHFIYYINRSIATEVDSTYLGYQLTTHNICLVAAGGREPVTSRSFVSSLADFATNADIDIYGMKLHTELL